MVEGYGWVWFSIIIQGKCTAVLLLIAVTVVVAAAVVVIFVALLLSLIAVW